MGGWTDPSNRDNTTCSHDNAHLPLRRSSRLYLDVVGAGTSGMMMGCGGRQSAPWLFFPPVSPTFILISIYLFFSYGAGSKAVVTVSSFWSVDCMGENIIRRFVPLELVILSGEYTGI